MDFKVKINRRNNSDKVLLEDLQKVAKKLSKKSVTRNEYDKNGTFSSTTIENRFGTWTNALLKAGFQLNQNRNISKEELLENLAEVWQQARWFGKNEFLTKNPARKAFNLFRYGLIFSLIKGTYLSFKLKDFSYLIFKIVYDSAVSTSVLLSFFGEQKNK